VRGAEDFPCRALGAVHHRPGPGRRHNFAESEFFDPRDLMQVKYEMLRRVGKAGPSITGAAARFGFSRPSFYPAQSALARDCSAGLIPLERRPKQARPLTAEVVEFIRQARPEDPTSRAAGMASRIKERFDVAVHPRTIGRELARDRKMRHSPAPGLALFLRKTLRRKWRRRPAPMGSISLKIRPRPRQFLDAGGELMTERIPLPPVFSIV
jgi:transposase